VAQKQITLFIFISFYYSRIVTVHNRSRQCKSWHWWRWW